MAKFFRRILCPIDFDENSMAALDYACRLAADNEATLYVLHAIFLPLTQLGPAARLRSPAGIVRPAREQLEKAVHDHLLGKVRSEILVRSGEPAAVVIKAAEDIDADLLVMATHGRTGIQRLFLGSVAEQVVRESRRPVLTLRSTIRRRLKRGTFETQASVMSRKFVE